MWTQLTAFTAFETCKKLNSLCCIYLDFLLQILVMSLKKKFPVYYAIIIVTQFIKIKFLMRKLITNGVWKICLDFLPTTYQEFSRDFVTLDSWKFGLFENWKEIPQGNFYLALFFTLSKSKWFPVQPFLIQSFKVLTESVKFHQQVSCISYLFYFKHLLF